MLKKTSFLSLGALALATLSLSACQDKAASGGGGASEGAFSIVGSSTVFPYAQKVVESYSTESDFKAPVLEQIGTGAGISKFCAGIEKNTASIANASRRMKLSEFETCQENGVKDVVEVMIGIDGITIAQSVEGPEIALTEKQIYEALAAKPYGKEQTTKKWSDVDPSLPDFAINVYGPPDTSGTRDAFEELVMEKGCLENSAMKALKDSDEDKFKSTCHAIRNDGPYIQQTENDNLIVQKLISNTDHLGIFGYSYMEENAGKLRGVSVQGVAPTNETIQSGEYPGSRKLYFYIKKAHVGKIPGLKEYAAKFIEMASAGGPLTERGLIALPQAMLAKQAEIVENMTPLDAGSLK